MTLLSDALKEKLMDVRLRDKLMHEGKVTPKQLEEYLNSLSDDESKAILEQD